MYQAVVDGMSSHNTSSIAFQNLFQKVFSSGTIIKIPNTTLVTSSDEAYGISTDIDVLSQEAKIIPDQAHIYASAYLTNNGFVKVGGNTPWEDYLYYNTNSKVFCTVTEYSFPFRAFCAKETWIADSEKELALELASVKEISYLSARSSKIENSPVSPYQRVTANIGSALGLYYRVSPNSAWVFFKGTQAQLLCSDFTGDAAKAFAGTKCWDESTNQESTVEAL